MTNDNGKKTRKITLTVECNEDGVFRFKSDDLGSIYNMQAFLADAVLKLDNLIRKEENVMLQETIMKMVTKASENQSRIIDPGTRKPIVKGGR